MLYLAHMKATKNIPLLIGIALPVIFILVISIVIFTPSLFLNPQYNFLYSNDNSYYNQSYLNTYVVKDNHVSLNPTPTTPGIISNASNPTLFLYDVKNNSTHQVDFNEAKNFIVDPGPSSPDGYIVKYQYSNYGIFSLFGSNDNQNGYVISKGNSSKHLNGLNTSGDNYYSNNFKFIGWVK
jgi:hypothetical protein